MSVGRRTCRAVARGLALLAAAAGFVATPAAQHRHAVIVTGASGGEKYAESYETWRRAIEASLRERFGFHADRIVLLFEGAPEPGQTSSRENVRRVLEDLRRTTGRDDLVLMILIGHGTVDADTAKFNLVGPDLEAAEWGALLRQIPARLVVMNTTGGSFPFLEQLSGPNRVVVTATDSSAQRFDTVFPEYLVEALADPDADTDKNGRLSLWEVFARASAGVARHYEQRGQLSTERALLDDNGDRVGLEAGAPGHDGAIARTTYLDADPLAADLDPALAALAARQRELERQAEELKLRKATMAPDEWASAFEALMIELARVSRRLRNGS